MSIFVGFRIANGLEKYSLGERGAFQPSSADRVTSLNIFNIDRQFFAITLIMN